MRLNINDDDQLDAPDVSDVECKIDQLGVDEFLILTSEPGFYVQTYQLSKGVFTLEYRQGAPEEHYSVEPTMTNSKEVKRAFGLFLRGSAGFENAFNWQLVSFEDDVSLVSGNAPLSNDPLSSDPLVEYRGMLMPPDWPQEIEEAQNLREYQIQGQAWHRMPRVGEPDSEADNLCQECGVRVSELHVPGCRLETCPCCRGVLVECACEIEPD